MKKIICILIFILTQNLYAADITIINSYIRLMPPGVKMTAGYFLIDNKMNSDVTLIEASSSGFKTVEIHNTVKQGDIMKMIKQDSVIVKANSKLEFKPMSYHLMLIEPEKKFKKDDEVDITFKFLDGSSVTEKFIFKKMSGEMNHDHSHMDHGNMMKNMKRPDFVYPAGVKGGKNMMSKKIMFGYKFGTMEMDCCKDGTRSVSESFIQGLNYSMTPLDMTMDMHMFSAMYAVDSKFSLMFMLPYIEKEMEMKMMSGMMSGKLHKTQSRGFGDITIAGLYKLSDKSNFKLALSVPTGEYDEKDHNMSGTLKTLPYPMQLGSGTYDLTLGYSFHEIKEDWSYGFQINALTRFDYNSENWKYGDKREISAWLAKPMSNSISISLGLDVEHNENISGKSSNRMTNTPTWNEYFHSHLRVSSNIGINYKIPNSKSRIGFQCGTPIYRDVNGPQMDPNFKCSIGFSTMM